MAASIKQLELIDTLVTELALEGDVKAGVYQIARQPDARPAHEVRDLITGLIVRRDARRAAARADRPAGRGLFEDVPDGRYAISRPFLHVHDVDHLIGGEGDMIFVRVNTWTPPGKAPVTYLRQLKGAPGAFDKLKLERDVTRRVVAALQAQGVLDAGLRFSQHYSRCARCLAELTDQRSRETGYGPDCRGVMGIA